MTKERRRFWLSAGAALLAGLLLRLWFIGRMANVSGDSLLYGNIAKTLLLHGVYGFTWLGAHGSVGIYPTLIRLPGYPLFLAACFRLFGMENYRAVLYVQLAADLLTCWLAAALAGRLFGRRAVLPVLWLAALCPFPANYVAAPLTETLVLTTVALAFYALARWQQAGGGYNRWVGVIVAALAYSILLRPEQGLLAAAIVPAMLWSALATPERRGNFLRAVAPVLVACVCVLLPLVPWTARNWRTFHVVQPLAPRYANDPGELPANGFNRWFRTWGIEFVSTTNAYWNYNGDRIEIAALPPRAFAGGCIAHASAQAGPFYSRTAALLNDYNLTTTNSPAIDARFEQLADERIHAAPICYYVVLPVARVVDMLLRPRAEMLPIPAEWWKRPTPGGQMAFAAAYAALNLVYFLLGFAGLRAGRRVATSPAARAVLWAMAACFVLRIAMLLTLDNSEARYTLEFFPLLFVWIGGLFGERAQDFS